MRGALRIRARTDPVGRLATPRWARHPATAAFLFFALATWAGWWIPLNNDVSWQYWIARQVRGGATLYRDIVEVNPPLWFWEAVPVSALADRLRIDAGHLAVAGVMARAPLALGMIAALDRAEAATRAGLRLTGLAVLLCLLPLHDFAEREHLMLIGALPYAALVARRHAAAAPVSPRLATGIGLFAACGFAMKPHFALVPLALEAWLAAGAGRAWRPIRPETIALALVAILYAAAIPIFAPDYLRLTLPLARAAYGAFSPPPSALLEQPWVPACVLAMLALGCAWRALQADARAAAVTATALAACYVIQGKGFSYHALPVAAALGWALWLLLTAGDARTPLRRPLGVLALTALLATGWLIGPFQPARAGRATATLERLPAGSTVAVISAHSWFAFPLVEQRRFRWPMRNIGLWTIPRIARDGAGPGASAVGRGVRRETLDMIAEDLGCHPPDAILVDDPARSPDLSAKPFSYEAFVRSDPRLRTLLASYRPAVHDAGATLYLRQGGVEPRGRACRPLVVRPDFP